MANGSFNRGKRFDVALSHANLIIDSDSINAKNFAPLRSAFSDSVNFYHDVTACIPHLLFGGRPSAIFRGVVAVNVFPIYRMLGGRFLSHIGKEIFKRVLPSVADYNSSSAILRIFMIIRIVTASFYKLPTAVLRGAYTSVRQFYGVAAKQFSSCLARKTPATECSSSDIRCCSYGDVAAIALAHPHGVVSPGYFYALNNRKTPEFLSLNVSHCYFSNLPNSNTTLGDCKQEKILQ